MLMIFDLLTSPHGHQFEPRMKMFFAFCSARHPRRFDMPHDHFWFFWPPWHPSTPKSHPWGMTQVTEYESRLICFVSFIGENTHKFWFKNLWNWHGNQNLMIFDLWPHPKVTSLTLGWNFTCILFCSSSSSIWYAKWPCLIFDHLGTPSTPKSHPWGMTQATEWKSCLICFVSFNGENTHKVWNKNLWNWLWN